MSPTEHQWYAVATKPRQEETARLQLERQGYSVCLPLMGLKKRRRGKWCEVVEPTFPGYLFVALLLGKDDPAPIRSTIGCRGLVRFGNDFVPVPSAVMEPLLALANEPTNAIGGFQKGDRVRLEEGPFVGLSAVFSMPRGEDRAQLLIELLGKWHNITVPIDSLSSE